MTRVSEKSNGILKQVFMFLFAVAASLAMSIASMASCNGEPENYKKSIVTYYALDLLIPNDSACLISFSEYGKQDDIARLCSARECEKLLIMRPAERK